MQVTLDMPLRLDISKHPKNGRNSWCGEVASVSLRTIKLKGVIESRMILEGATKPTWKSNTITLRRCRTRSVFAEIGC